MTKSQRIEKEITKTKEQLIKSLDYKDRNEASVKAFIPVLEEKFGKIKRI